MPDQNKEIRIQILSKDRTGLICEITKIFSDLHIDIRNHSARTYLDRHKNKLSECYVKICPESDAVVTLAKRRLRKLKGVISVI